MCNGTYVNANSSDIDAFLRSRGAKAFVPLSRYTTWRVGGPARWFWDPKPEHVGDVLRSCHDVGLPVFFLGRGSNVLVADEGLPGLVICTRRSMMRCEHLSDRIVAEAGVPLPSLAKFAGALGFSGYEFLIGIPGTVGGGLFMNAGLTASGVREIGSLVESIDIITLDGTPATISAADAKFGYRTSIFQSRRHLVLRATFRLDEKGDPSTIRSTIARHLVERRRKQPLIPPTAGSTFKQPPNGQPAGWYIERAGLKGFQVGGALVSKIHANWIENTGNASANDIRQLISHIQDVVYRVHGVILEREVRYLPEDDLESRGGTGISTTIETT